MSLGNWAQFVGRGTIAIDFRVENKWRAWVSIDSSHERTTILSPKVMVTVENISDQFPSNCFYSFTFEDLKANCQNGFQRRRIVFVIRVNNRRRKIKTNNHHKGFRFHLETGDVILVTMTTTLFFFLLFIHLFSLSLSLLSCIRLFEKLRCCGLRVHRPPWQITSWKTTSTSFHFDTKRNRLASREFQRVNFFFPFLFRGETVLTTMKICILTSHQIDTSSSDSRNSISFHFEDELIFNNEYSGIGHKNQSPVQHDDSKPFPEICIILEVILGNDAGFQSQMFTFEARWQQYIVQVVMNLIIITLKLPIED